MLVELGTRPRPHSCLTTSISVSSSTAWLAMNFYSSLAGAQEMAEISCLRASGLTEDS